MKQKNVVLYVEAIFNILYLCTVLIMGVYIVLTAKTSASLLLGIAALVLVLGDSWHLLPRIGVSFSPNAGRFAQNLGIGKMVASISMTLFYVFLWHIGILYFSPHSAVALTILVYLLALARIILTLLPQNRWGENVTYSKWNIYRNIPFALLGFIVGVLFFLHRHSAILHFKWMWLAILLSFVFYIPVVVGAKRYPALGMLMLPKSCIYIWIIAMGLSIY